MYRKTHTRWIESTYTGRHAQYGARAWRPLIRILITAPATTSTSGTSTSLCAAASASDASASADASPPRASQKAAQQLGWGGDFC